jgi:DNA-binding transcriptional LysR family regulator
MATGSFTKAAETLQLTQSAVSRSLAALEFEVGFKILKRRHGNLVPTAEGEAFYREAERILNAIDDLPRIAKDIEADRGQRLRIVALPQLARGLLPDAIASFAREFPKVQISLDIWERRDIEQRVAAMQFDVGLAMLPLQLPSLKSSSFATLPAVVVLPRDHRLAGKRVLSVADLALEPFIALDRTSMLRHIVEGAFLEHGIAPRIRVETTSALVACQMVGRGIGISVVDPFTALLFAEDKIELRSWGARARLTYGFVYLASATIPAFVARFMALTSEAALRITAEVAD